MATRHTAAYARLSAVIMRADLCLASRCGISHRTGRGAQHCQWPWQTFPRGQRPLVIPSAV